MLRGGLRGTRWCGGLWRSLRLANVGGSTAPRCLRALSAAFSSNGGGERSGGAPPAGSGAAPSSLVSIPSLCPLHPARALRRCCEGRSRFAGGGRWDVKRLREGRSGCSPLHRGLSVGSCEGESALGRGAGDEQGRLCV